MTTTQNHVARPLLTDDDATLGAISSFADAMQLLNDSGIAVRSTEEFGSGFKVLENKDTLVGVPFVILGYRFNDGDMGEFVSVHVVTESGGKWIVNDGSTGICAQLKRYESHGITSGLFVPEGLTRSDYKYVDPNDGKERPATTFYLS